jgi:hypothetical protein
VVRAEFILSDLHDRYDTETDDSALLRLYIGEDDRLLPVFISLHGRLNGLFDFMNEKKRINGHYNAEQSRQLLDIMVEIDQVRADLHRIGLSFSTIQGYESALEGCKKFLSRSGGSTIPEDFGVSIQGIQ